MSGQVATVRNAPVQTVEGPGALPAGPSGPPAEILPAPGIDFGVAGNDVMALLYALTAKQRDTCGAQAASAAERKGAERRQAFEQMRQEIQKANDAREDGGWLDVATNVLDAATDAVVGGNPLQDVTHAISRSTGIKAFDVAYDFVRPDALMHGAAVLASEATGSQEVAQTYDVGAANSSLRARFQGTADLSGRAKVMDAYAVTRDGIATAMASVGTCGVGTVAVVAIASSACLMLEAKADLLGKMGASGEEKMWIRLGAQAVVLVGTIGATFSHLGQAASVGAKVAVNVINGSNQIARGSVQVGHAAYEREASEHLTASARHQNTQHRSDREQQRIITGLREVSTSYQRALETLAATINERDQTPSLLARHIA